MGLTVDFSMGFVCFDAASKVGVWRSIGPQANPWRHGVARDSLPPRFCTVCILGEFFSNFSVLPADGCGCCPSQSRLLQQRTLLERTGRKRCHIVPRFWPRLLLASVFLKDATRAARVLFTQRNAPTGIHMSSSTAGQALAECFYTYMSKESRYWQISAVFECIRNSRDIALYKQWSCNLLAGETLLPDCIKQARGRLAGGCGVGGGCCEPSVASQLITAGLLM